jgi:hypothetical protein
VGSVLIRKRPFPDENESSIIIPRGFVRSDSKIFDHLQIEFEMIKEGKDSIR